ncbi:MAG: hypothetical protein HQM08_05755 [Candidatus Riflebacteria bacterium]|nr:hypothetical protein [Candidatus Riflebacteria bacterium]
MSIAKCRTDPATELRSGFSRWKQNDTIVIPAYHRNNPEGAFWVWKPALGKLERLVFSYNKDYDTLLTALRSSQRRWMTQNPVKQEFLVRHLLSSHSVQSLRKGAFISGPLNGINTYLLDIEAQTYSPLCKIEKPPAWSYSPTPGIAPTGDQIFTARWPFLNESDPDDSKHYSEVVGIDLKTGIEKVYARTPVSDNIHQLAVLPNGQQVLLNEFLTDLNGPMPEFTDTDSHKRFETLRQIGVRPSRLVLVDLQTGDYTVWTSPWPAPTHVVFDPDDPAVFYLVCHNIAVISGKMHLFGPGCLVRMRIKNREFQVEGHYSHDTFHRLASHDIVTYHGRKAIAITVFPNRCEIIDADRLICLTSIELYPIAKLEEQGLTLPDLNAEYAFSVCSVGSDDVLVLNASRHIYVVDLRPNIPKMETLFYNETSEWVSRAHIAWQG